MEIALGARRFDATFRPVVLGVVEPKASAMDAAVGQCVANGADGLFASDQLSDSDLTVIVEAAARAGLSPVVLGGPTELTGSAPPIGRGGFAELPAAMFPPDSDRLWAQTSGAGDDGGDPALADRYRAQSAGRWSLACAQGARLLIVHDVRTARRVADTIAAVLAAGTPPRGSQP